VSVGEAARAPVLQGHDVTWLRLEFAADLAAPSTVCEDLARPCRSLNWRDRRPALVVARAISTMQRVEDAKPRGPRRFRDLCHVRNAIIGLGDALHAIPELAALGNEIVVGVDYEKSSAFLLIHSVRPAHGIPLRDSAVLGRRAEL